MAIAIFALYHHFGQMYLNSREGRETQGPSQGEPLKPMATEDVMGAPLDLPLYGTPTLVVFTGVNCPLCARLRPDLEAFTRAQQRLETIIICTGEPASVREWAGCLTEVARVIPDPDYRIAARYGVGLTPFLVSTDSDGVVRVSSLVNDREGLELAAEAALRGRLMTEGEEQVRKKGEADERLTSVGNATG